MFNLNSKEENYIILMALEEYRKYYDELKKEKGYSEYIYERINKINYIIKKIEQSKSL